MNDYVDLGKIVRLMGRWLWLVLLSGAVAAAAAYLWSQQRDPTYRARSTVMIGAFIQASALDNSDVLTSEVLARTYADMALRQPVLEPVVEELGLAMPWRQLVRRVEVDTVSGTQLLEIEALAGSPEEARAISDAIARRLIQLSPTEEQGTNRAETVAFVTERLTNLQAKIEETQARITDLENAIMAATSPAEIEEQRLALDGLQLLLTDWESNYILMLGFLDEEGPSNSLSIVEPALAEEDPVLPRTYANTVIGGLLGLLLALAASAAFGLRDARIKSASDAEANLGLPVLGTVDKISARPVSGRLLESQGQTSRSAEAYRIIRSNFEFMTADDPVRTLLVTSAGAEEGKSLTVANLGIIMARAGIRTIIVDADMRRPAQRRLFRLRESHGLADALRLPDLDPRNLLMRTPIPELRVLTSGLTPQNPAELIRSDRMRVVLADLAASADLVICDSPPVLGLTDASILANRVDSVVLVVDGAKTQISAAKRAAANLRQAGASLLGVIVNRVQSDDVGAYTLEGYGMGPVSRLMIGREATSERGGEG